MYYMTHDGTMMAVEIDMKNGFQPGVPKQLFKMRGRDTLPECGARRPVIPTSDPRRGRAEAHLRRF
jgi:hypothetical protein